VSISKPSKRPTGVVIGAGDRGANAYVRLLLDEPELGRIIGVAERNPERRKDFAERFGLAASARFAEAYELLEKPRMVHIGLPSRRF
jgi:predicted dehydrogenase